MNTPRYATAAAKLLKRHLRPATASSPSSDAERERERGIATIEQALRARARRRQRLAVLGGVSALVAAAGLVLLLRGASKSAPDAPSVTIDFAPSGRGASIHAAETGALLPSQDGLSSGQRIDTPADGGAALTLSTGSLMTLAGLTSFRVDSQGPVQSFSLQQGEMQARVAKLSQGQRFIVATPDAEIEVRGTKFRLRVLGAVEACDVTTRTRLEVSEGAVEVRALGQVVSIKAGAWWPAACGVQRAPSREPVALDGPGADQAAQPSEGRPSGRDARPGGYGVGVSAVSKQVERDSPLASQNDLFADGVARRRQGDVSGALRAYEAVLTRFPKSPLAENALVERMRLLASTKAGRAEARRYLARYPRGFAVDEAEKLAAEL